VIKNTLKVRLIVLLAIFSFFAALVVGSVSTYMSAAATMENTASSNQSITI